MTMPVAPDKLTAANRNDWRGLQPMPMTEMPVLMSLYMPFTEARMANIRLGSIPFAMEQKWFTYFADSALHIYQSWNLGRSCIRAWTNMESP